MMIKKFCLIRNVGCFDSYQSPSNSDLAPLTLIYAENARGKTTLSAILRSLASGNSAWIVGRKRLGSSNEPHVVIELNSTPPSSAIFQNNAWNKRVDSLLIFDDQFVDENVYSGLSVAPGHRQNLHEVILGQQGVALARKVDELTDEIANLAQCVKSKAAAIPQEALHALDIDAFCSLVSIENLDEQIADLEKKLAAMRQSEKVRSARFFSRVDFPKIDLLRLSEVLGKQLPDLDNEAVTRVNAHFERIGKNAEQWVADGTHRIINNGPPENKESCPYCGQSLTGVDLVSMYRAYFGKAYRDFQKEIADLHAHYRAILAGDKLAHFQRSLNALLEQYRFWSDFIKLPPLTFDLDKFALSWTAACNGILRVLETKRSAPLEVIKIEDDLILQINRLQELANGISQQVESLLGRNDTITELKEAVAVEETKAVADALSRAQATKQRFTDEVIPLCDAYLEAKQKRLQVEQQKKVARDQLDAYRKAAFPSYSVAVNKYLKRFGAVFQLEQVQPQDAAGRPSTAYQLLIRQKKVPLASKKPGVAEPFFGNSLSAGDRTTLALSFFFASLDLEPDLANKIVVIDDPVSSLDDGRIMTTMQEVRRLCTIARQVMVLSHQKPFLCRLHKHAKPDKVSALTLLRCGDGESSLGPWQPSEDELTAYDHRHKLLREFKSGNAPNIRNVAESLRPVLEGYLRVAFPEYCPPETLLGSFRQRIQSQIDAGNAIMEGQRLVELNEIVDYANRFHHESNPAWESEHISDAELLSFVNRVFAFIAH
jgi:wobble nucleotide-excising tRNase